MTQASPSSTVPPTVAAPRRTAIYIRTARRSEAAEIGQLAACREVAAMLGLTDLTVLAPEQRPWGISPEAAASLAGFDVVLVHRYDRLSRKMPDMLALLRRLEAAGTRLIAAADLEARPSRQRDRLVESSPAHQLAQVMHALAFVPSSARESERARARLAEAAARREGGR